MKRREFMTACAAGALAAFDDPTRASPDDWENVRLRLQVERPGPVIPRDFMGLGYEISSVGQKGLLSGENHTLVQFVRLLGPQGVIRIGGNTSDFATFSSHGEAVSAPKQTVVNQGVIEDLGAFLRATGWRLIWGLNLGKGSTENAAEEAAAVASSAGDALLAFEIGNEPDLFSRNGHRPPSYDYTDFYQDYQRYVGVIRKRVPGAPMAGPDAATRTDWVDAFARDERSDIKLLTHHYYAEGPPQNPASTLENLLNSSEKFESITRQLRAASQSARVPYRICEINSCFGGGKAGVSDTFASAVWGLDLMFDLAAAQGAGLNMETGLNQLGWVSKYTPIDTDGQGNWFARPLYYGMLAFALASRGQLVGLDSEASNINFRAYAVLGGERRLWVTLLNKDTARGASVTLELPRGFGSGNVSRLSAPSMSSTSRVTLGGSEVTSDGQWSPTGRERLMVRGKAGEIQVPPVSACIIELAR